MINLAILKEIRLVTDTRNSIYCARSVAQVQKQALKGYCIHLYPYL